MKKYRRIESLEELRNSNKAYPYYPDGHCLWAGTLNGCKDFITNKTKENIDTSNWKIHPKFTHIDTDHYLVKDDNLNPKNGDYFSYYEIV